MQLPIESALLVQLLDYWALPHAESLVLSESIDPKGLEEHLSSRAFGKKGYTIHKTNDGSRDLVFVAASDLPDSLHKLLFYLSKLRPGGIAIVERPTREAVHYKKLAVSFGMQFLYQGKIKDLPAFSLPASLRSHANTPIVVLEKLLPKSAGKKKVAVLLTSPNTTPLGLARWLAYLQSREMEERCEIFYRTNTESGVVQKTHAAFLHPIFSSSDVAFVRSALCLSDSRFFLLDGSTERCFVPCDEMQGLLLAMLKHQGKDLLRLVCARPQSSDPKTGRRRSLKEKVFYELWSHSLAEDFFVKTSWPKTRSNFKKTAQQLAGWHAANVRVPCHVK